MSEVLCCLKGFKALIYLNKGIILARFNNIYFSDLRFERIEFVCSVGKLGPLFFLISRIRLLQRLFRLELGPASPLLEPGCFLVFFRGNVFFVDVEKSSATLEFFSLCHKRPLQLLLLRSGPHAGSVLLGDYQSNFDYNSVNIYRRKPNGVWDIAFTFPEGEINHVHGIFEDSSRNILYILTGDFGSGACIWLSDLDFMNVRPLSRSGQKSRACWVLPFGNLLVFATDQQAEINYLCTIDLDDGSTINQLFPIVGSSICSSNVHVDPFVFSTAVEPISANKITLGGLLSSKPAPGILGDVACVYVGSLHTGFRVIFSAKKDFLPFGLFQFGNILFPVGDSANTNYVHFYCSSLLGHDGNSYFMTLQDSE
ncbi:hypothetical protein [Synechococcus sp. UW140]|uniref:hypothetical protein n=1 Tax=Synechococcus sp. UW140 TaxID=368503 RepID=UPI003137FC00